MFAGDSREFDLLPFECESLGEGSCDGEAEGELVYPAGSSQVALRHQLFECYRSEFSRCRADFRSNAAVPFGLGQ